MSSIALKAVLYVPGGTFTMGLTIGNGDSDEHPKHTVKLSSFYLGKFEVTQKEWMAVMGANPAHGYGVGDDFPVYFVSWYAVLKFCNLLSKAEELTPVYSIKGSINPQDWGSVPLTNSKSWDAVICDWKANGYRLPTEAEWEYAARGASSAPDYIYAGSNDPEAVAWNSNSNYPENSVKKIGLKLPNGLGIHDMSGNLWEWCWDKYSGSYYLHSPEEDPRGPEKTTYYIYRVIRGGMYNGIADHCRVANRDSRQPYTALSTIGFRLCRSANID